MSDEEQKKVILKLLMEKNTTKEIARKLGIANAKVKRLLVSYGISKNFEVRTLMKDEELFFIKVDSLKNAFIHVKDEDYTIGAGEEGSALFTKEMAIDFIESVTDQTQRDSLSIVKLTNKNDQSRGKKKEV